MDSSNSQPPHSHPANSDSDPAGSAFAYDGSGSDSQTHSEGDDSSSSMQWTTYVVDQLDDEWKTYIVDQPDDEEDMDVNMADSSISTKPSTGKEKEIDTTNAASNREGEAEEIGLLVDLYELHNKTGRYKFSGPNGKRDFYKFWIVEERDYASKKELDEKIDELHERFLKNMDKNVDCPTDPMDVHIFQLSHWIWGDEVDSYEETDDDDDQEEDAEDLSDVNVVDDGGHNVADRDSSSKTAAADQHKDSTKESGGPKDSSSKANGKGFAAS